MRHCAYCFASKFWNDHSYMCIIFLYVHCTVDTMLNSLSVSLSLLSLSLSLSLLLSTQPLSLSEQYNIHSDLAPPTFSSSAKPTPFTSSFLGSSSNCASSKPLSGGAIYSNDDISGLNKAPGVSGILKPSQMFKKHDGGSHDQAVNGSHTHSSHVTSSEVHVHVHA